MTRSSVDLSLLTQSLVDMFSNDPVIAGLEPTIERAREINVDVSRMPWTGVYKVGYDLETRTLGAGPGYRRQRITGAIVCQQAHPDTPEDCEDLLSQYVKAHVDVMLNDESLGGILDNLETIGVVFDVYKLVDGACVQQATIQFAGIKLVD